MKDVRVEWVRRDRNKVPENCKYYPVSKFPDETESSTPWSVVLQLGKSTCTGGKIISFGTVNFLMDNAPSEKLSQHKTFEIYEGPKKVADVFII